MGLPTSFGEFNEINNAKGYSNSELLEIVKAHSHPDFDSFEACPICNELYVDANETFLIYCFENWNGEPSREAIEWLWTAIDGHVDPESVWSYNFKAELGLSPNAPDELLIKVPENWFCVYSNEFNQDHDFPFVTDFNRLKAHPRATNSILDDYKNRMHDGYFWNDCRCPDPDVCPVCMGMHGQE